MAIAVLLVSFLVMILLRFPIAYAVALSSLLCLLSQGLPLTTICQQMVKGISSFSLMAVPFFITMGVLMGTGGISDKLIALADACVGWMTGGMAMVNIVASYFFGGISGSASADTASIGSIMIPMMVDQGYDDDFSTAVTITSSCEGLLVPPSHNMVIYAMSAGGVSVGSLFLAGYVPGALLAISLMIGSYIISKKRHYPKGISSVSETVKTAWNFFLGIGSSCNRSCRRCSRMVYRDRVRCDRSILQLDCQCIYLQGSYLEGCLEEPGAVH